jgi:hypothetical protein
MFAAAATVAFAACTDVKPTGPDLPPASAITVPPKVPPGPPADAGKPVGAVTVAAGATTVEAAGSVNVTATVTDTKGTALCGIGVTWSSTNGGSFTPQSGTTDADGHATTSFQVGTIPGTQHGVTATSSGHSASVTITVEHGPAAKIAVYQGNGGNQTAGTTRTISALVTDAYDNPVPGWEVDWSVTNYPGDANSVGVSPGYSLTDANGVASATLSVGISAGPLIAEASSLDAGSVPLTGSAVRFALTVVPGDPATVTVCPASNNVPDCVPSATVSSAVGSTATFVVQSVKDTFGNAITSYTATWTRSNTALVTVSGGVATVVGLVGDGDPTVSISAHVGTAIGTATLTLVANPGPGPASTNPSRKP